MEKVLFLFYPRQPSPPEGCGGDRVVANAKLNVVGKIKEKVIEGP